MVSEYGINQVSSDSFSDDEIGLEIAVPGEICVRLHVLCNRASCVARRHCFLLGKWRVVELQGHGGQQ